MLHVSGWTKGLTLAVIVIGMLVALPNALNDRMQTYLGRRGAAAGDFVGGHGAILLDDTRWAAVAEAGDPRSGAMLQVTGADGTVLRVRAAS